MNSNSNRKNRKKEEKMETWKLQKEVEALLESQGLEVTRIVSGNSPYAGFDLIAHPVGFKIGKEPALYTISPVEIKSEDPSTAYKGRHAVGRLIMATPVEDGLIKVGSNSSNSIQLVLADGLSLGKPVSFTIGDLFPGLSLQ